MCTNSLNPEQDEICFVLSSLFRRAFLFTVAYIAVHEATECPWRARRHRARCNAQFEFAEVTRTPVPAPKWLRGMPTAGALALTAGRATRNV